MTFCSLTKRSIDDVFADYYMIDGVRHDAVLYICYVNGAAPRSDWFDLITRYVRKRQRSWRTLENFSLFRLLCVDPC